MRAAFKQQGTLPQHVENPVPPTQARLDCPLPPHQVTDQVRVRPGLPTGATPLVIVLAAHSPFPAESGDTCSVLCTTQSNYSIMS